MTFWPLGHQIISSNHVVGSAQVADMFPMCGWGPASHTSVIGHSKNNKYKIIYSIYKV